ncbi:hypothetical protein Nepgr_021870 [Nepenthes gracilis]|uniref:Uncharacterized protein n=1 Tax=Nepenthes gracilis TaxID=150966 RepID=A0AAD3SZY2_NEPGR|nr:hypothetical protein Nepgr_021870 [Nepenthes gracilis]
MHNTGSSFAHFGGLQYNQNELKYATCPISSLFWLDWSLSSREMSPRDDKDYRSSQRSLSHRKLAQHEMARLQQKSPVPREVLPQGIIYSRVLKF